MLTDNYTASLIGMEDFTKTYLFYLSARGLPADYGLLS